MVLLNDAELNEAFLTAMGSAVLSVLDPAAPVLEVVLAPPNPPRVRVYIFNATNPSGGRPTPEHKIQLAVPGHIKGERRDFDRSGGFEILVAGKVEDQDAFVLWDADLYHDIPHSRNVQIRTATINAALAEHRIVTQNRTLRSGEEEAIATPADLLPDAVRLRLRGKTSVYPTSMTDEEPPVIGQPRQQFAARERTHELPSIGGVDYVVAVQALHEQSQESQVFQYDPNAIDRGTRAHMAIQNGLAESFSGVGLQPLSPAPDDPDFDLACRDGSVAYVVEVKSLTVENEAKQLRLGLGQVLSYAYRIRMAWNVDSVRAVLAVEYEPIDGHWLNLCEEHGVILTWPADFPGLF